MAFLSALGVSHRLLPSVRGLSSNAPVTKSAGLLGLPFNRGQLKKGVERGPKVLRAEGLINYCSEGNWKVVDYGDLGFDKLMNDDYGCFMNHPRTTGRAMEKVQEIRSKNDLVISVGGDHSVAIGTIHGHLQHSPEACVVWVDAHADINAPSTSDSGNIHGMPLSFLLHELKGRVQEAKDTFTEWQWLTPCLRASNVVYIGLRDLDPDEKQALKDLNIKAFCMYEVDKYGISACLSKALQHVNPNLDKPIHVSFDIDVVDPMVAGNTGTPVIGGLTIRESFFIAEELASTGCLSAVDMVEVNPVLHSDAKDHTLLVANKIIGSFLDSRIL